MSETKTGRQRNVLLDLVKINVQHTLSLYTTGRMARQIHVN